ncbi:hypothetical protein HLRTI_002889 [Halorhabdus tiamatea SARL4B]|uniref:Uncharacterized protein n=1 Tax=Halorhabdus tiamatea SARL4B TaxID=1033806 RepID=U2F429_9EURY|nr:hypothetical protein [Halorhabdus tiamatea]ERJ05090.1 hypothetical protein HLRTI_002889 [Halorhabdus tiamatea SARL4B]
MSQSELSDFGSEIVTDGGQDVEAVDLEEDPHFDPSGDSAAVSDAWEGVYIYASWGYGQTNVDMAQIVEVSDTGKTVKARKVTQERVSAGRTSESVRPAADQFGDEFRLQVRDSAGDPAFRGSYPLGSDGDMDKATRRGWFYPWSKKAGDTVHKTAPGFGH